MEEILINVNLRETRVAIVEKSVLQEVFVERSHHQGLVGNIYMGKVVRVLPGMQAAFIDVGFERAAFLHVSDMGLANEEYIHAATVAQEPISQLLKEGQKIVVQVVKDPIGTKGARLTTQISIPSRYLVFMPMLSHVGVSSRIESEQEKERLKTELEAFLAQEKHSGFIIRTVAEGVDFEEIKSNYFYLIKLWETIQKKIAQAKSGDLIYEELSLDLRALRDYICPQTEKVRVDDVATFERVVSFVEHFIPTMVSKIELYQSEKPIFDFYAIEDEIQKALERKVQLKCGGYIVFDQTESMTTIDVNTGAFVGHRNVDETILKTNLEAANTIARQLRLRNLGGIIIIDFIDMANEEDKAQVLAAFEKALARDHTKSSISQISGLGLVEMTRKRTRESLEHVLCETCSFCEGRGTIKTVETVCYEIFRELMRKTIVPNTKLFLVLASEKIVERMLEQESAIFAQFQALIGKPIQFQVENLYTQEQFDIVLK